MKILIDTLSAREGGGITYINHILPALVKQKPDWEFTVLLSKHGQDTIATNISKECKIIRVNVLFENILARWLYLQFFLPAQIKKYGYDILFCVSEISAIFPGCRKIHLIRNYSLFRNIKGLGNLKWHIKAFFYRFTRFPAALLSLRNADRLVFVSQSMKDEIVGKLGSKAGKSYTVHHGLNPIFSSDDAAAHAGTDKTSPPYILTVASIMPYKNIEVLISAFKIIMNESENKSITLKIAGRVNDPNYYKHLNEAIAKLNLSENIVFLKEVSYKELPDYYKKASCFVLTSKLESFGHPLIEAMACGTPVVASDLPVSRELCEDSALYFNANDYISLAAHLNLILRKKDIAKSMSEKGLKRAKDFSWEKTAGRVISIFEEAAG
jgi:glycosyltransferase involved in cell wall biosynthesis